ncbi:MAG TPA: hypothetical protein VGB38_01670, partial [bacterium]
MFHSSGRFRTGAILAVIFCFVLIAVTAQGGQPTAEKVLAAYTKAIGGEAVTKIKTMVMKFRFSGAGLPQPTEGESYIEQPDKNYIVIHLSSMGATDYESGVKGDTAWRNNPGTGFQLLEGDEKKLVFIGTRLNPFDSWQKLWKTAEMVGEDTVAGVKCYKIALTPAEGEPLTAYFDKKTGLLVQESVKVPSAAEPLVVTCFSDYRQVGGIRVPFRIEQKTQQPWVIEYTDVQPGAVIPAGRFDLPEAVKSLVEAKADTAGQAARESRRSVQLGGIREI